MLIYPTRSQLVVEGTIRKGEKPIVVLVCHKGILLIDLDQFAMTEPQFMLTG